MPPPDAQEQATATTARLDAPVAMTWTRCAGQG